MGMFCSITTKQTGDSPKGERPKEEKVQDEYQKGSISNKISAIRSLGRCVDSSVKAKARGKR